MDARYRISVTTLEKFRRYMDDVSSFDNEAALLASIRGIFKGSPKTEFGGAYHKLIEGDFKKDKSTFTADGYFFTSKQAKPAIDYRREHPLMIHEMNVSKIYETAFFPIQVCGRVDGAEGIAVRDIKAKFRKPDWQEYIDSCQWKIYLDCLDADIFYYDVFEISRFDEESFAKQKLFPDVIIHPVETLQCLRYHSMKEDIMTVLNDFLEYITNRDLFQFLKIAKEEKEFYE